MVSSFSGPWAMIEDFNSIKNAGEKRGGNQLPKAQSTVLEPSSQILQQLTWVLKAHPSLGLTKERV